MSTYGVKAVLGIALSAACLGCAPRARTPFIAPEDARINIEVINHAFQDATLYALWANQRIRLGTVSGTRTANYMVPWTFSDLLQIEIDMLAGQKCTTLPIMTDPGDIILLEIDARLASDPDCLRNDRGGGL